VIAVYRAACKPFATALWGRMPSGARLPTALFGIGRNVGSRVSNLEAACPKA